MANATQLLIAVSFAFVATVSGAANAIPKRPVVRSLKPKNGQASRFVSSDGDIATKDNLEVSQVRTSSRWALNSHAAAVANTKLRSVHAKHKKVVTSHKKAVAPDCTWWLRITDKDGNALCALSGLSRRSTTNINICATNSSGPSGAARKTCSGHAGAVTAGAIANAPYAESFDSEGVLGAWTTAGSGSVGEVDANGKWQCIEDSKYNWVDNDNCNANPFNVKHRTDGVAAPNVAKHPDDLGPLQTCWSCGWIMWYKKFHCKCCNPNELIGDRLNGEECCDGIDMACGINGHDRRDGTPRGKEVCEDLEGDPTASNEVCTALKAQRKPAYSSASRVQGALNGATPYVHTQTEYDRWLHWDSSLCFQHKDKNWCKLFPECTWDGDANTCNKNGGFAALIDSLDDASLGGDYDYIEAGFDFGGFAFS